MLNMEWKGVVNSRAKSAHTREHSPTGQVTMACGRFQHRRHELHTERSHVRKLPAQNHWLGLRWRSVNGSAWQQV